MAQRDQNVKLLNASDSDSDYQASAYDYDTGSESVNSKHSTASSSKVKKQFKSSTKKKIQLTFTNLSVKTIAHRKKFLCCEFGERLQQKTILENVSGTICPGQFVAILGSSGNIFQILINYIRCGKNYFLKLLVGKSCRTWIIFENDREGYN